MEVPASTVLSRVAEFCTAGTTGVGVLCACVTARHRLLAGNAALCLSKLALVPEYLPRLAEGAMHYVNWLQLLVYRLKPCFMCVVFSLPLMISAIAPLIELLKLPIDGPGLDANTAAAAQKNAAIGLARLAKHPSHLVLIRELRGMEILVSNAAKFRDM